jgi:hypothetical protein
MKNHLVGRPTPVGADEAKYQTWANYEDVSIVIDGIDARTALLSLDLLRKKSPEYEGFRIAHASALRLIQKMFKSEFQSDMPPPEMARHMGASIRAHDAESVLQILNNASQPY